MSQHPARAPSAPNAPASQPIRPWTAPSSTSESPPSLDSHVTAGFIELYRRLGDPPGPLRDYALVRRGSSAKWMPVQAAHVAAGNEPYLQVIPAEIFIAHVRAAMAQMPNMQTLSSSFAATPSTAAPPPPHPQTAIPMPINPNAVRPGTLPATTAQSSFNPFTLPQSLSAFPGHHHPGIPMPLVPNAAARTSALAPMVHPPPAPFPQQASAHSSAAFASHGPSSASSQSVSTAAAGRFQEITGEAQARVQNGGRKRKRFTRMKYAEVVGYRDASNVETALFRCTLCRLEVSARTHFVRHLLHDCTKLPTNEDDAAELIAQREKRNEQHDSRCGDGDDSDDGDGDDGDKLGEVTIESLRATVAQFVATSHSSARIVGNSSLRRLVQMAQTFVYQQCAEHLPPDATLPEIQLFKMPSDKTVAADIIKNKSAQLDVVRKLIAKSPGKATIAFDGWTCNQVRGSFVGVTIYFITEDGIPVNIPIAFRPEVAKDAEGLKTFIVATLKEFGVSEEKLLGLSCDNVAVNTAALRQVAEELGLQLHGPLGVYLRCGCHFLQLGAGGFLVIPLFASATEKVHKLCYFTNNSKSTVGKNAFQKAVERHQPTMLVSGKARAAPIRNETRWNGKLHEADFFLAHYPSFVAIKNHPDCPPFPSTDELNALAVLVDLLRPIEQLTVQLQAQMDSHVAAIGFLSLFINMYTAFANFGLMSAIQQVAPLRTCPSPDLPDSLAQPLHDNTHDGASLFSSSTSIFPLPPVSYLVAVQPTELKTSTGKDASRTAVTRAVSIGLVRNDAMSAKEKQGVFGPVGAAFLDGIRSAVQVWLKYESELSLSIIVAQFLDPTFGLCKLKSMLYDVDSPLPKDIAKAAVQRFRNLLVDVMIHYVERDAVVHYADRSREARRAAAQASSTAHVKDIRSSSPIGDVDPEDLTDDDIRTYLHQQLRLYDSFSGRNDPGTEGTSGSKRIQIILKWWRQFGKGFPTLARMAWSFCGMPLTSVDVERLFSQAGIQMDDLKSKMSPEQFEARLLLNALSRLDEEQGVLTRAAAERDSESNTKGGSNSESGTGSGQSEEAGA